MNDVNSTSPHHGQGAQLVGWTFEPNRRGTFGLLLSCLATIALCTWVVIHARIDRRERFRIAHKLALCFKTFLAPEFIAVEAAQEWTQARRLVKDAHKVTTGELRIVHAYYIGMFGIRYRTSKGTKVLWPNQILWLLNHGLFDFKDRAEWGLEESVIKDKSNADSAAKLFALAQSVWFVMQCILRAVDGLPISPLESMTLGYIPLFFVAYAYWWVKPKDIELPSEIELPPMSSTQREELESLAVSNAFDDEGKESQTSLWTVWYLTPRVFEKEQSDRDLERRAYEHASALESMRQHMDSCEWTNCQRCRHHNWNPPQQRAEVVLSHWDPELYCSWMWPIICLVGISFPALHLVSWDTDFPSKTELWLWRGAGIASIATMLVFMHFEKITVRWQDPWLAVKLISPLIYLISRVLMLALAAAAFRASDPAIYQTYNASDKLLALV